MNRNQKPKVINERRFLDPDQNKLRLNKFHQIDSKEKKRGITNKIRDLKRLIDHAKDKVPALHREPRADRGGEAERPQRPEQAKARLQEEELRGAEVQEHQDVR